VQIEQAGHERHPFGVDAAGAGGQLDFRRDGLDAVAADEDGSPRWLGAGPVNHGRANDGDYIFVVLFAGVGGEKANAGEHHNRQQSAFHQVSGVVKKTRYN
jgi:hypothetical protein